MELHKFLALKNLDQGFVSNFARVAAPPEENLIRGKSKYVDHWLTD